ncbi:hypothetical protein GGS26DRAFT_591273 [Hypomontagnella submonticulosa]|nr:hypothetical protein GGS26DRAFT_591273 [Hypomontagnella submonticulosa]
MASQTPAINHPLFSGVVHANGYVVCTKNGCGAVIQNATHDLSSHLTKFHNPGTQYQVDQATNPRACSVCQDYTARNYHSFLGHCRREHGFRGLSGGLRYRFYMAAPGGKVWPFRIRITVGTAGAAAGTGTAADTSATAGTGTGAGTGAAAGTGTDTGTGTGAGTSASVANADTTDSIEQENSQQ